MVREDAPAWVNLTFAAYQDSPLSHLYYSVPASQAIRDSSASHFKKAIGTEPNDRLLCIRDPETSGLIAAINWFIKPERTLEEANKPPDLSIYPKGFNPEAVGKNATFQWQMKLKHMGTKPYIRKFDYSKHVIGAFFVSRKQTQFSSCHANDVSSCVNPGNQRSAHILIQGTTMTHSTDLQSLTTHPDHCRKGYGTQLLRIVIAEAAILNLPILLCASPSGYPLYLRNGFRPLDTLDLDTSSVGFPGPFVETIMIHDAPLPSLQPNLPSISQVGLPQTIEIQALSPNDYEAYASVRPRSFDSDPMITTCFGPQDTSSPSRTAFLVNELKSDVAAKDKQPSYTKPSSSLATPSSASHAGISTPPQ
jgi:GNAT superfamily N-acetyltransferase